MKSPAEMYACLYAREFPAQAMLRLRPTLRTKQVAILQGEAPRQFVCSRNAHAASLGISAEMTRAELDVFPAVTLLPRSVAEEDSARAALLQWAGRFSPRVEDRSEEYSFCAILDIAGTEKLFGPAKMLAQKLLHGTRALGVQSVVTASSNIDMAICRARSLHTGTDVIARGHEATELAPLPISVLQLTADQAETLAHWGIGRLGELAALPQKELIARLGQEGQLLRQLARGEAQHLLAPEPPAFTLEERMELDSPVELLDSLLFVLGVLLDHLIARATAHIVALAAVTVVLNLDGGGTHTRTVRPAQPGNDRRLWRKLLQLDLQAHPPAASILAVTVSAEPGSTSKVQPGLFSPQLPEPSRLDVTLARIRSIVGQDRAGRPVLEDSHRPDAFRVDPFAIPQGSPVRVPRGRSRGAVRRLRPPELVPVTLSQRRPVAFVFRNRRYLVEQSFGPWFSSGNWWGAEMWSVEKWDLIAHTTSAPENETICCCLARHPAREDWRIEALYD